MFSISAAFYQLRDALSSIYDTGEATAMAHATLQHLTGLSRLERLDAKATLLNDVQQLQFSEWVAALMSGMPLQYVLGTAHFMGHDFFVDSAVLIPRPETEELVRWIIDEAQAPSILDIGTGSGCIAISLKLAIPASQVSAIDVSEEALAAAKQNASKLGADVGYEEMNFLDKEARERLSQFEVIVSNPPYIPLTKRDSLHRNVRDHEPPTALFVPGDDPLQFYKAIADFGLNHLTSNGSIYCELHQDHAHVAADLFRRYGYGDVHLKQDMQGADRMLRAKLLVA